MSSATSIDGVLPPEGGSHKSDHTGGSRRDAGGVGFHEEKPATFSIWHFFALLSLLAATVAVLVTRQNAPESLILISLTIGAAGAAAAGLYRTLAPLAKPDTDAGSEPLSERLRVDLEREKMLTLRSIKELEFDRAMGKVSESDWRDMSGRLRARAAGLMRQLDAGSGYREQIERDLDARLKPRATDTGDRRADSRDRSAKASAERTCANCRTVNDPDARFCKQCGAAFIT
jgi:hypothetical protein